MLEFLKRLKKSFEEKRKHQRLENEKREQEEQEQQKLRQEKRDRERLEHERIRQQQREDAKKNKCPYCGSVIDKEPKGKFKCPSCKNDIYLQKSGTEVKLLTKDEREQLNAEKKARATENKYFRFFESLDVKREYLEERRDAWFEKLGDKATYPDLTWSVSHELLQKYAKSRRYVEMQMLYHQMARMQYEAGKDFFHLLQEAQKMSLYHIRQQLSGNKDDTFKIQYKIVIIGKDERCNLSHEMNGQKFTIKEAIEKMPIPRRDCKNDGWCTCCYATEIER